MLRQSCSIYLFKIVMYSKASNQFFRLNYVNSWKELIYMIISIFLHFIFQYLK